MTGYLIPVKNSDRNSLKQKKWYKKMVGFLDFYDSDVTRSSGPRWPGRQAVAGAHAGRRARGCPASPCNMLLPPHPNVKRLQGNACRINRRHAARAVGIAATCCRPARRAGHRGPGWRRAGAGHSLASSSPI